MMQLVLKAAFALAARAQGGPSGTVPQSTDAAETAAEHSQSKYFRVRSGRVVDQTFAARQVIEKAVEQGGHDNMAYAAFVDLEKAYDI